MAESRGGRGNAVLTGFRLHRPAARPSARGQIPRSFGQECPWSRYPGMLWYSQMPRPPAGGAMYNGHAVLGVWTGPQLRWHINCLELLAVRLALSRLRGRLQGKDVLVHMDNTATVAYINRQGGFTLPSHVATCPPPPPLESEASEVPSCHPHPRSVQPGGRRAVSSSTSWGVETPSPGGPADWSWFGAAQVDLVASPAGLVSGSILAQDLSTMLLATAPPWPIPLRKDLFFQRRGTLWHPRPDLWKLHVWSLDGTRRI